MIPDFSAMTGGHLFLALFFPAVAAVSFYYAWRGLRGTRRSWVYAQYLYTPFFNNGRFNNLPFRAGAGGVFALVVWADTVAGYTDHPELADGWPMIALWAVTILATIFGALWWPPFLAPHWYRDWQFAGRRGRTLPYSKMGLANAAALPDGPEKQRLLQEFQSCRNMLKTLKMSDQRYGRKV